MSIFHSPVSMGAWLIALRFPEYYRQTPPKVPNFLKTLFRRKLVLWFLASEILRDYWLSGVSTVTFIVLVYKYSFVTLALRS